MKRPSVVPGDFFVLRTPMLPWDELEAWSAGLTACRAAGEDLPAALAADRAKLRERLREIVARPEVSEALLVSSPALFESLPEWLADAAGERGQKIERALVRYVSRMTGRATPFGLCAGSSLGRLGETTALVVGERARHGRRARLDMDHVCSLSQALARDRSIAGCLRYHANSTLYRVGDRMRYAEVAVDPDTGEPRHRLTSVDATDHLLAVLAPAERGATAAELAARVAEADPDASLDQAAAYVGDLIDNQILVSALEPEVTGDPPVRLLIDKLRALPPSAELAHAAAECLDSAERALSALDAQPAGTDVARYHDVARALASLPAEVDRSRLVQVELVKPPSSSTLGANVVRELEGAFDVAWRLTALPPSPALSRFAADFERRYESREIPLCEAVDPELGVGFGSAGSRGDAEPGRAMTWTPRALFLHRKLRELGEAGAREWAVTPADVEELRAVEPEALAVPDALSVHFSLFTPASPAPGSDEFRLLLDGAVGPPGVRLLGRFLHGDEELLAAVRAELRVEESRRPDAIHAEVVHLPSQRAGNVILRPVLREYEIPYLARSGAPPDRQLPVADLRVSVREGVVRLRSERLDREVVPRLTTAHDYLLDANLPVYRLLCELQGQGRGGGMSWIWRSMVHEPFLPRVSLGRTLLSLASWGVDGERLRGLVNAAEPFAAVQALRARLGWPRHVGVADADHLLPVDLDNALCVDSLVHLARRRRRLLLFELCPEGWRPAAAGPDGRFVHEIVLPLRAASAAAARPGPAPPRSTATARRSFPPGSEWLFVKLYAGETTGERLLRRAVHPIVRDGASAGRFDRWFFVRYADPDHHLRIRFHGARARLLGDLLPAIEAAVAPFLDDREVWRMQVDTYEREVERYGGGEAMSQAEQIFHADSDAALELIVAGDESEDERPRIAALGLDLLLGDFGLDAAARLGVLEGLRDDRARELGVTSFRESGQRFRRERPALERLFAQARRPAGDASRAAACFQVRSNRIREPIERLRALAAAGRLTVPLAQLARAHLHMHANRLIKTDLRRRELLLYDFLIRLHRSWTATARRD